MRASRGEMDSIVAVSRAWVSAFSLRLLVQLRRQSSIFISVFLSAGWIKRRMLARDCSPKSSIEKKKSPGSRRRRGIMSNTRHLLPRSTGVLRIGPERQAHPFTGDDVHTCVKSAS